MPFLKLCKDEIEPEAPQPIPFQSPDRSWRTTDADDSTKDEPMDSIARVEEALNRVENTFDKLSEQIDEFCEPIRMSDWIDDDDDGPYAA